MTVTEDDSTRQHHGADAPDPTVGDRRALLRAPLAAALAVVGAAAAVGCDLTVSPFDRHLHLLRRLTFGPRGEDLDELGAAGEQAWLDRQLAPSTLDTSAVDAKVAQLPAIGQSALQLFTNYPPGADAGAAAQLQIATILRAAESPAQVYERMVEFWSDHFNVPMLSRELRLLKVVEDRTAIRPKALTTFAEVLVASATSPAMMVYLDNYASKRGAINENYGRELLELHALGVSGGYTESDVVNTARLFTGWTVNETTGAFTFRAADHDTSPLTILGWTRPGGTNYFAHGLSFLQYLAMHPSTARFVSTKLAVRFVGDQPDPGIVTAMTDAWLASGGSISAVLRAMVAHPAFDASWGLKFRRPLDHVAAVLRSLRATLDASGGPEPFTLFGIAVGGLRQLPFSWPAPDGYPDDEASWLDAGALLGRWNLAGDLVANGFDPVRYDTVALRSSLRGLTAVEIYEAVSRYLLQESIAPLVPPLFNAELGWTDTTRPNDTQIALALPGICIALLCSPDAQYR